MIIVMKSPKKCKTKHEFELKDASAYVKANNYEMLQNTRLNVMDTVFDQLDTFFEIHSLFSLSFFSDLQADDLF